VRLCAFVFQSAIFLCSDGWHQNAISLKKCNNYLLLGSWPAQCEERMPVQEGLHVVILPAIYLECCEPETFRIAHETWCLLYDCVAVGQFQCFLEVMLICQ